LAFADSRGVLGPPAPNHRGYASVMRAPPEPHGFQIPTLAPGYYQSDSASGLLPAYALSALYELLLYGLDPKNLAANVLLVARRPGGHDAAVGYDDEAVG